jgi:hypothetical protein
MLIQFLLLVVPEFLPGGAAVLARGDARLEVDGAHVHDVERVLHLQGRVGHQAGVHGNEGAELGDSADAQDHGALLQVCNLLFGKFLSEPDELGVTVGGGVVEEVEGVGVGGGRGGEVVFLGLGDSEKELVFPVAANAGGVEFLDEFDYARGVGSWWS